MLRVMVVVLMLTVMTVPVFAEETAAANVEKKAVDAGNKLCPVSGEKVGDMGDPILKEYNGKIYKLCCSMCVTDFEKDPEKFSKIADEEVAAAQK